MKRKSKQPDAFDQTYFCLQAAEYYLNQALLFAQRTEDNALIEKCKRLKEAHSTAKHP